jgi:hypothetical protein
MADRVWSALDRADTGMVWGGTTAMGAVYVTECVVMALSEPQAGPKQFNDQVTPASLTSLATAAVI